jgi:lipopolysaccharide biosynthesis regulator YciM
MALCDSAEPHLQICSEEIDSVSQKAKLMLARCFFDAKKYEESIATFEKIIQGLTLDIQDLKRYAGANFLIGDTTKALQIYENIIRMDSTECKLTFQTAVMYFQLKKYDDAIRMFSTNYKDCNENLSKNYFYIGNSYLNKNLADSAIVPFRKSYQVDTTNIRALIYVADSYAKMNMNDSAVYYFEFVINKAEVDTANYKQELSISYQKLCGIYLNDKKSAQLKKISQAWINYFPDNGLAYLYLGASYQLANDTDNACKNYRLVLKFDKDNKFAKDMLGKLSCP